MRLTVKVLDIDPETGKMSLSRKVLMEGYKEEEERPRERREHRPRSDSHDRHERHDRKRD